MQGMSEGKNQMIVTLTGSNQYQIKQKLDLLIGEFVKQHGELALEKFDGEELEVNQLVDAVQNLPFLSTKKMVVVRNLSLNKTGAETIEQIISAVHEGVDLIFYEPHIDKRTGYYKVLKSKTDFLEMSELDNSTLAKWLVEEASQTGARLSQADAIYLIDRVGTNQVLLANELTKLITYSQKITRENINLLTEKTPQSKVFDLMDAAFAGNRVRALELYDEQRAQKVEPQEIIAMFAWQLRLIAAAKYAGNKKPADIAKDFGMSPYPVTKAFGLAKKTSEAKLTQMVSELLKIDRLGKTSPIDLDEALKNYIIGL